MPKSLTGAPALIPVAVPRHPVIEDMPVDTLDRVDALLALCSCACVSGDIAKSSRQTAFGLMLILDACRDAVQFEKARIDQGGVQ